MVVYVFVSLLVFVCSVFVDVSSRVFVCSCVCSCVCICVCVRVCVCACVAVTDHTLKPYYGLRLSPKVGVFITENRVVRSLHR